MVAPTPATQQREASLHSWRGATCRRRSDANRKIGGDQNYGALARMSPGEHNSHGSSNEEASLKSSDSPLKLSKVKHQTRSKCCQLSTSWCRSQPPVIKWKWQLLQPRLKRRRTWSRTFSRPNMPLNNMFQVNSILCSLKRSQWQKTRW